MRADLTIRTVRLGIILCTVGYAVILFPLLDAWLSGLQFLEWTVPSILGRHLRIAARRLPALRCR